MANTTQVSFRIDENIKKSAESALEDMGLTMSAAITVFLKKIGREHRIPFEITADPFYSKENIEELEKRVTDAKAGRNMHEHGLIEVE